MLSSPKARRTSAKPELTVELTVKLAGLAHPHHPLRSSLAQQPDWSYSKGFAWPTWGSRGLPKVDLWQAMVQVTANFKQGAPARLVRTLQEI